MRPEFGAVPSTRASNTRLKSARTGKSAIVNDPLVPRRSRDFARPPSANSPRALLCCTRRWPGAEGFRRRARQGVFSVGGEYGCRRATARILAPRRARPRRRVRALYRSGGGGCGVRAPAGCRHAHDRFHSEMDQRLPQQARTQRRPGAGAYPQRHAGLQGRRNLGRLCRLHRRRHRRQSRPRRGAGEQNADDRAGGSMGAGAGDRLFRPAELEELAADFCRPAADAPRHDRQIPRRQAADARSDRLPAGKAGHARQDQSGVEDRRRPQEAGRDCRRAPS